VVGSNATAQVAMSRDDLGTSAGGQECTTERPIATATISVIPPCASASTSETVPPSGERILLLLF
jgi:hypothetical protein